MSTVSNKTELKKAIKKNEPEIVIEGDLVQKIKNLKRFGKIGLVTSLLAGGAAALPLVLAPFTKGSSLEAYVKTIETTAENPGTTLPPAVLISIIAAATFSIGSVSVITAILNNYEVIELDTAPPKLILRKSQD